MTSQNENPWRLPSEAPLDGTRVRVWVDECDGFEHPTDCVAVKGYKPGLVLFRDIMTDRFAGGVAWRPAESPERPSPELIAQSDAESRKLDEDE